ncbi:neuropeptide SIFamide receptor-like [Ostrea edulis]|uniref:neuropeptide SIFamide receptor-like n=1 Tax=Ostrea edulis TaxID=37623 RepID=UPI0024AFB007|nr:neuropeptide SIFamide receptor-like [Ostrea edulis]
MNSSLNWSITANGSVTVPENSLFSVIVLIDAISCVFLVIGNFFILALIRKKRLLGRSTNVFIFSIAVADFLNGSVAIPTHILFLYQKETIYLCKCFRFVSFISKTVVPYSIVFMTAEKTMRILCPTREIVTVARCMFCTSLLWFFSSSFNIWSVVLFTSVPRIPRNNDLVLERTYKRCTLNQRFAFLHKFFLLMDLFTLFLIPLTVVLSLFLVLLFKYFTILRERIQTYFFVVKLLMVLSFNVLVTHTPYQVITFIENTPGYQSSDIFFLSNLLTSLFFTRGIWNLLIYGYFKHYVCHKQSLASIRAGNYPPKTESYKLPVQRNRQRNTHRNAL